MSSSLDTLPKIGAPATRALNAAGYTALANLRVRRAQSWAKLHGMGPKALGIIEAALVTAQSPVWADAASRDGPI